MLFAHKNAMDLYMKLRKHKDVYMRLYVNIYKFTD